MSNQKPIIFQSLMVQAILQGRKTQTRRICKHQYWSYSELIDVNVNKWAIRKGVSEVSCPYGQPGDILYVRETFFKDANDMPFTEESFHDTFTYRADNFHLDVLKPFAEPPKDYDMCNEGWYDKEYPENPKWKPSIHMPKAAARIWLKVKAVRVERLNDISEEDALAEGIDRYTNTTFNEERYKDYSKAQRRTKVLGNMPCFSDDEEQPKWTGHEWRDPKSSFASLWISINGKGSLAANPWVWVVEFEVLSTTGKPSNLTL